MVAYGILRELSKITRISSSHICGGVDGILLKTIARASKKNDIIFLDQVKILICQGVRSIWKSEEEVPRKNY